MVAPAQLTLQPPSNPPFQPLFSVSVPRVYTYTHVHIGQWMWPGCSLELVYVLVASQVQLGWVWLGLDAWKPWTTLGRLVGFPPRLSARIEAHRHGSNVGTTAAA